MAGGDVEEAKLVRPGRVIDLGLLDRIAGVGQIEELHALDHAPMGDVEAGDDADADGHAPANLSADLSVIRPSYKARPTITPSMPSLA